MAAAALIFTDKATTRVHILASKSLWPVLTRSEREHFNSVQFDSGVEKKHKTKQIKAGPAAQSVLNTANRPRPAK